MELMPPPWAIPVSYTHLPIRVVDLPGTYSLGAYSEDEGVACDYILFKKPDVVINIVDATNLERNLYLTVQLMEMGANVVVALNMYDELEAKKTTIDIEQLEKLLGVPVVPTVAIRNKGLKAVSYTHLDVYKRQEYVRGNTSCLPFYRKSATVPARSYTN